MIKNGVTNLYLVCEGESDKHVLAALIHRVLRTKHSNATVNLVAAGGKQAIPRLVRALEREIPPGTAVGIVVDSDGDREGTKSFLNKNLDLREYFVIIAHPSVESWFRSTAREAGPTFKDPKQAQALIDRADLDRIAQEHPEFGKLIEVVTNGRKPKAVSSETFLSAVHTKAYS